MTKTRNQIYELSQLERGDRFVFPRSRKLVYEFSHVSQHKEYIYFKDGDPKEKATKNNQQIVFLRNNPHRNDKRRG